MLTLAISHLKSVPPKSSTSSRRHQEAAGFLTKGLFPYHLYLIIATKRKMYIWKIISEDTISLTYLGSLLFGMEKRTDPLNEEERDALKCTEAALSNHTVQTDKHYWKAKRDFGFLHFIHAWTQNLFPSRSLPFSAGNNHPAGWGWSPAVHSLVHTGKWQPSPSPMCGSQEKLGLLNCFSSLEVKLQQLKFHSKVTSDSSLMPHYDKWD